MQRARKIQRFLSQPFSVAQVFTGREGKQVPVADTVRGFKEILDGKCDDVAEGDFYMKGGIEEIRGSRGRKLSRDNEDQVDMSKTLKLQIVTPEATVYSEDVDMVTLPAVEGQIGILPNHVRMMTQMVPGEMIVRKGGQPVFLAVGGGLVEVTGESVSILTDLAIAVDSIDEAKAEEARQRAAARLREKISAEEVASVNASLARSLAQLHVKRRRRV